MAKSELENLIIEIKKSTKQISINKVDEVKVMKCMLNDKQYRAGIYDKNNGYVGDHCPAEEAVMFVKNVIQGATGLDARDSMHLAEEYEFTTKDAQFMISNMKDFLDVYTQTGRKINLIQNGTTDASIYTKDVVASTKMVPNRNDGESKVIKTAPFVKMISVSKCPKYNVAK